MSKDWETHWSDIKDEKGTGKFFKFYREKIIANAVAYYFDKYFPRQGKFIECGSGSSQSSVRIKKYKRNMVAIDISDSALERAKMIEKIDDVMKADILDLPFEDSSIDGIWNLGVMEHFTLEDIDKALKEFSRVLKPGARAILFWPPLIGQYHLITSSIEFVANKIFRKNLDLFPDEINLLSSKTNIITRAKKCGFKSCKIEYNFRDLYTYAIVICQK